MDVKDIKAGAAKGEVTLEIVSVDEPREFEKYGRSGRVANAKGKDATGEITLTLWNEDVEKIKAGNKVKITDGWAAEWQGNLQLSAGKFGKIEVI